MYRSPGVAATLLAWFHPDESLNYCVREQKVAGVGGMCMLNCFSHVELFANPRTVVCRLLCLWDSPGKNTGLHYHALPQATFLTQESNQAVSCMTGRFFTI